MVNQNTIEFDQISSFYITRKGKVLNYKKIAELAREAAILAKGVLRNPSHEICEEYHLPKGMSHPELTLEDLKVLAGIMNRDMFEYMCLKTKIPYTKVSGPLQVNLIADYLHLSEEGNIIIVD